jgi:HSP20 family protein
MRVTDLIPWRSENSRTPALRSNTDPLGGLQTSINRAFEDFWQMFDGAVPSALSGGLPTESIRVDVKETDQELLVSAELPGMEEDDIDVSIADGSLTIRAEKEFESEKEEGDYVVREREFGHVERTIPLPEYVDANAANAKFKNGVLTIRIPKKADAANGRKRISVKSH